MILSFNTNNKKESRMIQRRLIHLGFRWNSTKRGERERGYTTTPHNLHHKYIYVSSDKIISTHYHEISFFDSKECTILDLYVGHFIKQIT